MSSVQAPPGHAHSRGVGLGKPEVWGPGPGRAAHILGRSEGVRETCGALQSGQIWGFILIFHCFDTTPGP